MIQDKLSFPRYKKRIFEDGRVIEGKKYIEGIH